jgi:hypothetical protein
MAIITSVTNTSAGFVALWSATSNPFSGQPSLIGVPNGQVRTDFKMGVPVVPFDTIFNLAILGPGATGVGPGSYDWIYIENNDIKHLRLGVGEKVLLPNGANNYSVIITYDSQGVISAA